MWLFDRYRIVDTGSTDNTIGVIRGTLAGIPGEIVQSEWTDDFAFHRNQALPTDLGPDDFVLMMDADDEMVLGMPFSVGELDKDCYSIANVDAQMANYRPHLFKINQNTKWVGVRHEALEGYDTAYLMRPDQIKILIHHEGDRSNNVNKFVDDAVAIVKAQKGTPEGTKLHRQYTYLLATSYMDSQLYHKASDLFKRYLREAPADTFTESLWMAQSMIASCAEATRAPANEVVEAYMATINADPTRIEPYFLLSNFLIQHNSLHTAKAIMRWALTVEPKFYALKHMEGWWSKREPFYNEICDMIKGEL
jgi:glycosyltransferase involved in cell wall biosynthesis